MDGIPARDLFLEQKGAAMQVIAVSNYACITLYDQILLQYVHNYVSYHDIIIIFET